MQDSGQSSTGGTQMKTKMPGGSPALQETLLLNHYIYFTRLSRVIIRFARTFLNFS
jgi:hypothetical protein